MTHLVRHLIIFLVLCLTFVLFSFQVLKLLAKRYRASNPEGRAQVVSYQPRPVIKITPPPSAKDRRIKVYHYVDAVKNLPCNFSMDEVIPFLRRINPELMGQIRSLFIVLTDDQFKFALNTFKKPNEKPKPSKEASVSEVSPAASDASGFVQPKSSFKRAAKSQGGSQPKK